MEPVYKIVPASLWREAAASGAFRGAPIDRADGYIHLSTGRQVAETAARHFAGQVNLVLVEVDAAALGPALRWEPSRGGEMFPHLYGDLPHSAVLSVVPLRLGPDGTHVLPNGVAGPDEDRAAALEADGWVRGEDDRFIGLVGPLWARRDGDRSRFGFLAERRHLNRGGVVHGGMLMTFADQALGMAAWAANGNRAQATIQLDTHFIAGVQEGDFVQARCRVVRQTRSLLFMAGELSVSDRVVATAAGIWKMRQA